MRQLGLGVDCSGFAYHVLDAYLYRQRALKLADQLAISAAELLAYLRKHPEHAALFDERRTSLPRRHPLGAVCRLLRKDPARLTNAARLVQPGAVVRVVRAADIRPADLIKLTGRSGDHIAVVTAVTPRTVEYASSEDASDDDGLGGVRFRTIHIRQPHLGLESQEWDQRSLYRPGPITRDGVWRLRILA